MSSASAPLPLAWSSSQASLASVLLGVGLRGDLVVDLSFSLIDALLKLAFFLVCHLVQLV
eukprot:389455-Hanusia_phi.AAC.1